jgi:DNA mismatch endonuclease (patch repair protein)
MDNLTIEQRKKNMRNIKSKDTKPELLLRKALWSKGIRYRLHGKDIFGKPDIYIKSKKIAIFVDSDFWHGKLYKEGKAIPKSNQEYWISKLERNIERDKKITLK